MVDPDSANRKAFDHFDRVLTESVSYQLGRNIRYAKADVSRTVRTEIKGLFKLIARGIQGGLSTAPDWTQPWSGQWKELETATMLKKQRQGNYGAPSFFAYKGDLVRVLINSSEEKVFNQPKLTSFNDNREELLIDVTRKPYSTPALSISKTTFKNLTEGNFLFTVNVFPRLGLSPQDRDVAALVASAAGDRRVLFKLLCSRKPSNYRPLLLPALTYFVKGHLRSRVKRSLQQHGFMVK